MISRALQLAAQRGLVPSTFGSTQLRDSLEQGIRRISVFSARTANAAYLSELKQRIDRLLAGGYDNDLPKLRLELKQLLAQMGYTPEKGFPGDEKLGIPPAEPGSLQDLSSDRRLNLILETQRDLMQGAARYAEETVPSRLQQFPCWELVRELTRDQPRGSVSGSKGWPTRWQEAGGPAPVFVGVKALADSGGPTSNEGRLIAPKDHPVWRALGDSAKFDDALDVSHPPFAFRSGMGVREVHWRELEELGVPRPPESAEAFTPTLATPKASVKKLDPAVRAKLEKALQASYDKYGRLTSGSTGSTGSAGILPVQAAPVAPVPHLLLDAATTTPDAVVNLGKPWYTTLTSAPVSFAGKQVSISDLVQEARLTLLPPTKPSGGAINNAAYYAKFPGFLPSAEQAAVDAWYAAMQRREESRLLLSTTLQQRLQTELAQVRPTAATATIHPDTNKAARPLLDRAAKRFPDDWTSRIVNVQARIITRRCSAWTPSQDYPAAYRVQLKYHGPAYLGPKKGEAKMSTNSGSTNEHEFAHVVQAAHPELDRLFQEEHIQRTTLPNGQREPLIVLSKGPPLEVVRKDGYYDMYQGKEYGADAAEVFTMVLEPLLGEPGVEIGERLANLLHTDPRIVELALGALFHVK